MPNCRSCGKEIIFLRQKDAEGNVSAGANPIDVEKSTNGNLVISIDQELYRFATAAEKEQGKPLHISHFATCPDGQIFRRRK